MVGFQVSWGVSAIRFNCHQGDPTQFSTSYFIPKSDAELLGAGSLLKKYITLLVTHIRDIMPTATNLASRSPKQFASVADIIESDLSGKCESFFVLFWIVLGVQLSLLNIIDI